MEDDLTDDSYQAVFELNSRLVRSAALSHFRRNEGDGAVLVELPESGTDLAPVTESFENEEAAAAGLRELAADLDRRVFLVHRPPGVDLRRPGAYGVDVEWLDEGLLQRAHVPG